MAAPATASDPTFCGPPPRLFVIVLNWHGRVETLGCIRSLAASSYPAVTLVLVDNGCADFSAGELCGLLPHAQYLRTAENLGFAGGSNLGLRHALDQGAEYVLLLNNDARVEPDAIGELVRAARRDPAIGVAGAKIVCDDDAQRLDSVALRIDRCRGRIYLVGHDEIDRGQYDGLDDVVAVTGCAMLLSRVAGERLGGFDAGFFAYLEDADLCLRARAAGLRVVAVPRARVRHRRPPATGARQSVPSLYYTTRNHLWLMQRYGTPRGGAGRRLLLAAVVALNLAYALRTAGSAPGPRLRAVWRGVRDFRRGVRGAAP